MPTLKSRYDPSYTELYAALQAYHDVNSQAQDHLEDLAHVLQNITLGQFELERQRLVLAVHQLVDFLDLD